MHKAEEPTGHPEERGYSEKEQCQITRSSFNHAATPGRQPLLCPSSLIGDAKIGSWTQQRSFPAQHPNVAYQAVVNPYDLARKGLLRRWANPGAADQFFTFKAGSPQKSSWRLTSFSTGLVISFLLFAMWYLYAFFLGFFPTTAPLVLESGVGRLPALGWNSWNAYHCDISESQFLTAAQKFIDLGLKDAGYEYVNIDDCWQVKDRRDNKTNRLIPDPDRFPDGIHSTAKKIHDLGLKIGIYSSAGTLTCAGYQASIGYESIDAAQWAEWEIDYLKYDNCNVPHNWTDPCRGCVPERRGDLVNGTCTSASGMCPSGFDYSNSLTAERFRIMRDALLAQNRTILYSLCEWGEAGVQQWGNSTGSSWRMSGDIEPTWQRVLDILNQNSFYLNNVDFWGHSDADMLEVGNGLSIQESRSHFALWAAMKSPLLIGTDLARIASDQLEVLKNKYLLGFNQDPVYGAPAKPYKWGTNPDWTFNASYPAEYWSGASTAGTLVLMFNPYSDAKNKTADFKEIPELKKGGSYQVKDIWSGRDLGCITGKINVEVEGHDTVGLLMTRECSGRLGRLGARGLGFFGNW